MNRNFRLELETTMRAKRITEKLVGDCRRAFSLQGTRVLAAAGK